MTRPQRPRTRPDPRPSLSAMRCAACPAVGALIVTTDGAGRVERAWCSVDCAQRHHWPHAWPAVRRMVP